MKTNSRVFAIMFATGAIALAALATDETPHIVYLAAVAAVIAATLAVDGWYIDLKSKKP